MIVQEFNRLEVLEQCNIMGTPAESSIDRISALSARIMKVRT